MDDHVHVIVAPRPGFELSSLLHTWKSFTSHQLVKSLGRVALVWLDESCDRIIRDEQELTEKAHYILTNPQRR